MNTISRYLTALLCVAVLCVVTPAMAQTPDGATPAVEASCTQWGYILEYQRKEMKS
jgi:hypothetical protein